MFMCNVQQMCGGRRGVSCLCFPLPVLYKVKAVPQSCIPPRAVHLTESYNPKERASDPTTQATSPVAVSGAQCERRKKDCCVHLSAPEQYTGQAAGK
ncbi:hypothetical protein E2C01_079779 [Portunus trituberculatus]|uniref:Uncharacterized protein n=1 Tax=Portunus trituberculatus TaxID=210409 RepID=A0A5B7IHS1_PORTR|nr:hypothetical protein [Portunus trituberculatus]